MINRYSTISEKNFNLYEPPIQAIGAALETAQKTYDTNFLFANELKNKYINARSQDRARANELQSGWEQQVDGLVKSFNGDYSKASKDLYLLQKDIEKQYKQGGEAFAIEYNYANLQDSMKRNKEALAKGDIVQTQYDALYNYVDKNFQGTKKKQDGTYDIQNIPELARFVDSYKLADESTKGLKPRNVKETKVSRGPNGYLRYDTVETSKIDPQEVQNAITGAIMSNEGYLNYAKQMAQFTGQNPQDIVNSEINNVYKALGPTRSGTFNDSNEVKLQTDEFAMAKLKHQYALAEEYNKQRNRKELATLKGDIPQVGGPSNIRLIGNIENSQSRFKPLNGEISSPTKTFGQTGIGAALAATGPIGSLGFNVPIPFSSSSAKIDDVLKNPSAYYNINVPLLADIKKAFPKYTDRQVMDQYDRSLERQNQGEGMYVDAYRNPDTGQTSAELVTPTLLAGNAKAYFVGSDGKHKQLTPEEQQAYGQQIKKAKVGSLGQNRSFSSGLPVGEVLPVEGGYVVVGSNAESISQFNEYARPKMFDFIGDGRQAGEIFPVKVNGQLTGAQGVMIPDNSKRDEQGLPITLRQPAYIVTDDKGAVVMKRDAKGNIVRDAQGQPVPDYFTVTDYDPKGNPITRMATPLDMELMMLGQDRYLDTPMNQRSKNKDTNTLLED